MKNTPTLKAKKREFKPKPWLRKPDEEKIVQGYYYVKSKHKDQVKNQIDNIIKKLK
jgi:hypothetical protein